MNVELEPVKLLFIPCNIIRSDLFLPVLSDNKFEYSLVRNSIISFYFLWKLLNSSAKMDATKRRT